MVKIADKRMGVCECESCKYCSKNDCKCRFGLRDIGCYMTNATVKDISRDWVKAVGEGLNPKAAVKPVYGEKFNELEKKADQLLEENENLSYSKTSSSERSDRWEMEMY